MAGEKGLGLRYNNGGFTKLSISTSISASTFPARRNEVKAGTFLLRQSRIFQIEFL